MGRRVWIAGLLASVVVSGCGDDDASAGVPSRPTYWQDVAPIFFEHCVGCHRDGGIAPFRLDDYDEAKTWADVAKLATASRTMPPYLVTADGSCGEFVDPRWLTDAEIGTIGRWADQGAAEGTPRDDLALAPPPTLTEGTDLVTPEFTPEIVGGLFAEFDEYRCFLVDPELSEDAFMTGYDVHPGNAALVHHVLAMPVRMDEQADVDEPVTNRELMARLDAESPDRDGWPCFGMAGDGVAVDQIPVTWAPGMGAVTMPGGAGVALTAGDQIVIQVHYNLADEDVRGESDQTTVRLRLEPSSERVAFFDLPDGFLESLFDGPAESLPPGRDGVSYSFEFDYDELFDEVPILTHIDLFGVFPHMHERGERFRFEVVRPGGGEQCGAEVERWDFDWQLFYFYEQPIRIEPGTRMRVTCEYDTRGLTEPVLPGWGTQNEMCLAGVMLVPGF